MPGANENLRSDPGVTWLLGSSDPSVRYLTLTDVLGRPADDPVVAGARTAIPGGPKVTRLLAGQRPDGGFGVPAYDHWWHGTHWRLVSLARLAYPAGDQRVAAAMEHELAMVAEWGGYARQVGDRMRRHACVEGYALGAASSLGLAGDPRIVGVAERLLAAQWPDGGWNSDPRPEARTSSFWETHQPLWGLWRYHLVTGDDRAANAARRAAEIFLGRRLFRSARTGEPVDPNWEDRPAKEWTLLHYPTYWYYDILLGLDVLRPLGLLTDARADEALRLVAEARDPDGTWHHTGSPLWALPGEPEAAAVAESLGLDEGSAVEVVDWGRRGPNEMITLTALRVLGAAGRL